jgi:hypothetical protein
MAVDVIGDWRIISERYPKKGVWRYVRRGRRVQEMLPSPT